MTTRTLLICLLLIIAAVAATPVVGRVVTTPTGPPPPANLPECRLADLPASNASYDEWPLTLLDHAHRLPADYVPPDLVLAQLPGQRVRLRELVVPDLLGLLEAAREDGVEVRVTSGYRSYERQAELFEQAVHTDGEERALLAVARPGHSEHQLGTAVDLSGGADWLAANAWRHGFVLSYPAGRSPDLTCYQPEPWHYRYFGRALAAEIHASGVSPREWLWINSVRNE